MARRVYWFIGYEPDTLSSYSKQSRSRQAQTSIDQFGTIHQENCAEQTAQYLEILAMACVAAFKKQITLVIYASIWSMATTKCCRLFHKGTMHKRPSMQYVAINIVSLLRSIGVDDRIIGEKSFIGLAVLFLKSSAHDLQRRPIKESC